MCPYFHETWNNPNLFRSRLHGIWGLIKRNHRIARKMLEYPIKLWNLLVRGENIEKWGYDIHLEPPELPLDRPGEEEGLHIGQGGQRLGEVGFRLHKQVTSNNQIVK